VCGGVNRSLLIRHVTQESMELRTACSGADPQFTAMLFGASRHSTQAAAGPKGGTSIHGFASLAIIGDC
jgi:hypothetical protein